MRVMMLNDEKFKEMVTFSMHLPWLGNDEIFKKTRKWWVQYVAFLYCCS